MSGAIVMKRPSACPISNAYVVDGIKSEVIAAMLEASMRVTVNSDDPALCSAWVFDPAEL
jgi:adenosine deaminase